MAYDFTPAAADDLPPFQEHPEYTKGMAYVNAGQWQQALLSFQILQKIYPDQVEVKELLDEVQMRVTMARFQPPRKSKGRKRWSRRRFLIGALAVILLAMSMYAVYALWLNPLLGQEFRLRQVTRLVNQADEAIMSGDFAQARQALEQLQTILPKDPETKVVLARLEEAEKLAALYQEAQTLITAGSWEQALGTLTELQNLDAQYRDLPQLWQIVQEAQTLDRQFHEAEEAFAHGDWAAAIAQYEAVQQANMAFKFEEIEARFFKSHLKYSQQLLTEGGTDPEQVAEALAQVSAALKIRPMDDKAIYERRLAEIYLAALTAVDQDQTIELLQTIYDQQSDYAGRAAAQFLYTNLLARGDTSLAAGDRTAAIADYQAAAELKVEDPSAAQEKLSALAQ